MHHLSQRKNAQVEQENLVPIAIVVPNAGHRFDKDGNSGNALQLQIAAKYIFWPLWRPPKYWGTALNVGDLHQRRRGSVLQSASMG